MMNTPSLEPSPDAIIQGLHRIREAIVAEFGGDLKALSADARRRQEESGRIVWTHGMQVVPSAKPTEDMSTAVPASQT